MNKQTILIVAAVAAIVVAFFVGAQVYQGQRQEQLGFIAEQSFSTFVRDHSPVLGPADAKVYLIEFADPACETCAQMAPFVKQLMAANDGKVKLVVRCLPLHQGSDQACRLLQAAKRQDRYWQALDTMFQTQPQWASHHQPRPELLWGFLAQAGIDAETLRRDYEDPAVAQAAAQDVADAQALGVNRTPGFFVNGKPLVRFGLQELRQLVAGEVAVAYRD